MFFIKGLRGPERFRDVPGPSGIKIVLTNGHNSGLASILMIFMLLKILTIFPQDLKRKYVFCLFLQFSRIPQKSRERFSNPHIILGMQVYEILRSTQSEDFRPLHEASMTFCGFKHFLEIDIEAHNAPP